MQKRIEIETQNKAGGEVISLPASPKKQSRYYTVEEKSVAKEKKTENGPEEEELRSYSLGIEYSEVFEFFGTILLFAAAGWVLLILGDSLPEYNNGFFDVRGIYKLIVVLMTVTSCLKALFDF